MFRVDDFFSSVYSGVLVPGGFGVRGTEGKIQAISWARKQKKPFLGEKSKMPDLIMPRTAGRGEKTRSD